MKDIQNLEVNKNEYVQWYYEKEKVLVESPHILQAVYNPKGPFIYALFSVGGEDPHYFKVYSAGGQEIVVLSAPAGFEFSYLTTHPSIGAAVVAGSNQKIDNWYDWHFGYDSETKELFRHCPAY